MGVQHRLPFAARGAGLALGCLLFASRAAGAPMIDPGMRSEDPAVSERSWSRLAAESWLARAESLARKGETLSAITCFTESLRADPTLGRAYFGLAEIRHLQGDVREAERLLSRAAAVSEVRAEAFARRAALYRSLGRSSEALADWSRAAELEPSITRLRQLAQGLVERRAWVAALAVWRRIRALTLAADPGELRDTDETIGALAVLAAEADAVQHDTGERNWIRRALRHSASH